MMQRNLLALTMLAAACGPNYQAMKARNQAVAVSMTEQAHAGLPELPSSPFYNQAKAWFLEEEPAFRSDPEGMFTQGQAIPCAPMEQRFAATGMSFELLAGACNAGRFEGPILYRTRSKKMGITQLIWTTYVDSQPTGLQKIYSRVVSRDRLIAAPSEEGISYIATVENASFVYRQGEDSVSFGLRTTDPGWRKIQVSERVGGDRLRWRTFMGPQLVIEGGLLAVDGVEVMHGPMTNEEAGYRSCWDFGRIVKRDPCTLEMPPTEGVPPDADSTFTIMPELNPKWSPGSSAKGGGDRVLYVKRVDATLANIIAVSRRATELAGGTGRAVARSIPTARPAPPQTRVTTPPPDVEPPPTEVTPQPAREPPPPPTPVATAVATEPPAGQVAALCAAAAARQAELYSPGDAKLRASMSKGFVKECKARRWSMQRISCLLAAADATALGACDAMPSAPVRIKTGDAKACRAAAHNQAAVVSGGDANLAKSLAGSIETSCKKERWSAERIRCGQDARSADAASQCSGM